MLASSYDQWTTLTIYAKAATAKDVPDVQMLDVSVGGFRWRVYLHVHPVSGQRNWLAAVGTGSTNIGCDLVQWHNRVTGSTEYRATNVKGWRMHDAHRLIVEAFEVCETLSDIVTYVGAKTWRCGICGKALKDTLSAELGIGPECRKRHGELMVQVLAKLKREDFENFQKKS